LIRFPAFCCVLAAVAGLYAQEHAQLDSNETLFSVAATVSAALAEPAPAVREHLAGRNVPVMSELRNFVAAHRKDGKFLDWSPYISFALSSGGPPDFKPTLTGVEEPPDLAQLEGFRALLIRFYRDAALSELWSKMQPVYQRETARYHEPVTRAVVESNAYLRNVTSGYMGRRFFVFLEVLAPPNQVHTRSYKDDYFIVVTPAAQPRVHDVRHTYLHFVLDPLTAKFSEPIMKRRSLSDYAQGAVELDQSYKSDFLLLATESLIRGIESRMDRRPAAVQESLQEGFILTPFFAEALPAYEKQETAMRLYFPDMMNRLDINKEVKRLDSVDLTVRRSKPAAASSTQETASSTEPVRDAAESTIDTAEQLYASRNLDKAGETFRSVLQQTDNKPLHARAYYGLARIAALQRNPELAEQLFRKTLELSPDPHTLAWTEVYLGRLAHASATPEQAAAHFKAALAVKGASAGARQAAEEGLSKTR
jgi:tetratricopeptide (TPR) repeat protein